MARRRTRRRRITRRTPVKRRRTRRSTKKRVTKKSHWNKITTVTATLMGLDNITGHDMAATAGMSAGDRAKGFINSLIGRTTGFNPIGDFSAVQVPQQISLNGIFNKWSGISFAAWVYSKVPMNVPYRGKAGQFGRKGLIASVISGIFMPQSHSHSHNRAVIRASNVPLVTTK